MNLLDIGMLDSDDNNVIQEVKVWARGDLVLWGQTIIRQGEDGEPEVAHLSVNYAEEKFATAVTGSLGELIEVT